MIKRIAAFALIVAAQSFAVDLPKDLDVGVYAEHGAGWKEFPVEVVGWKTGGVVKSAFTHGIVKQDLNGRIVGGESRIAIASTSSTQIYIRTPEGVSAEEYQLLKLRTHSNAREFRSVTGGVFHVSGGASRDSVPFTAERVGPRLWRIILSDLPNGEYGFLPPVNSTSLAAAGKIYSFQVSPERIGGQAQSTAATQPTRTFLQSLLWPAGDKW